MNSLISVLLNLTGHLLPGEALVGPLLLAGLFLAVLVSGVAARIALWCDAHLWRS